MFTRHDRDEEQKTTTTAPDQVADRPGDEPLRDEPLAGRHAAEHSLAEDEGYDAAHARYGGMNAGADFFGWLVAVAAAVLMMAVLGAVTAAVTTQLSWTEIDWSQDPSEREAGTIGLIAAIVLLVVLSLSYYAGGYVAGRMSRFDGGRQGLGVWLIGLIAMVVGIGVGAVFGSQYNVLDRIDLPTMPFSDSEMSLGAAVTGGVLLLATLLAALAGGRAGRAWHLRVDRAHLEPEVARSS